MDIINTFIYIFKKKKPANGLKVTQHALRWRAGRRELWCLSADFLRDPLLASRDCENYQSETENGADENKLSFNFCASGG